MIVVFGSLNVDLVAHVARLPAAGETLLASAFVASPGGKGANQALAARRAGARVRLFGHVGRDAFADEAVALLRDSGVDVGGVQAIEGSTGVALVHVDAEGQNAITVASGVNANARAAQVPDSAIVHGTTLLMQLEVPLAEVRALAHRAAARAARVVLNASPAARLPQSLLGDISVLVVNETEADVLARDLGDGDARTLCGRFAGTERTLVVTRGAQGVLYTSAEGVHERAAPRVEAVDTVGAGDAFTGAFAAALDRGADVDRAVSEGLAAGAIACTRHGAQAAMPHHDEIRALADTL
ncbi:MAG TPA: ribokinase [Casimicrobiaceae bacterium]